MRRGELLALRWDDIDFDAGTVRVERTITKAGKGKGSTIGPTKTARGVRNVALSAACLALLRDTRLRRLVPAVHTQVPPVGGGVESGEVLTTLVTGAVGKTGDPRHEVIFPFSVNQLYERFVRLSASVPGLPKIRPHDARHSNVVAALEAGIPLIVISERLGHASIRITGDVYAHVTRRLDKASAETLGGLLLGEGALDLTQVVQDAEQ
jgi:integrase